MEWLQLIMGSGGLLGVFILIFRTGKIVERIDNLEEMKKDVKEIKTTMNSMAIQIAKLETRVEERTLRVVHVNQEERELVNR
jgi:hypothetical protein